MISLAAGGPEAWERNRDSGIREAAAKSVPWRPGVLVRRGDPRSRSSAATEFRVHVTLVWAVSLKL
jgi:hypothetical protein